MVATNLARHMSHDDVVAAAKRTDARDIAVLTPAQGAATQVWAAVSPELDGIGAAYLADCGICTTVSPYAIDETRARKLWELSESLVP
jgi:hypothetical protein